VARTPVVTGRTLVLSPPLRGGPWLAAHDPRWERGHRRVGYAIGGRLRTPGRYAADWVKLDASGRTSRPSSDLAAQA
jgi:murein DD-endopeptidase